MATATAQLTLRQFREQYANEPGYEYWFGELVRKSVPTWLHALIQKILCLHFDAAGYESAPELQLRIDPEWEPRPDVAASLVIEQPYPTKPVDIVAEVLSPDDRMSRVFEKCRLYARAGIGQIYLFDPELRVAWEWSRETENLERIAEMRLANGKTISVQAIWEELDRRLGSSVID
jgi:Uma2 family endonuclease